MKLTDIFQRKTPAEVEETNGEDSIVSEVIGAKELRKANKTLQEYKSGKKTLEDRLIAHEEFWKTRQWQSGVGNARISGENSGYKVYSTPWLHTCLETRIADAMDAYPSCNFRPRAKDDEEEANNLSKIVPVILSRDGFERTYRRATKYCIENGAFILGVFWDPEANNNLGTIKVKHVDAINLFWQPGIQNIQDSANVFYTTLIDNNSIERLYPETKGKLGKNNSLLAKYRYDDNVNTDDKSVVVDWYYRKRENGKTVLHYCKYVNEVVLYSSENEGLTEGYYNHGKYPFVMQPLFEVQGSPFGYGLIDICESTQLQIDILNKAICDNAEEGSRPRYFASAENTVNIDQLNDPTQRVVNVEGRVDEEHLREINTADLPGIYVTYLNNLVEQMKFCTANQDVNNGAAPSGVTSYSALSALQETSGKKPRDTNRTFYDAFQEAMYLVIELMRQFFTTPQQFRLEDEKGVSQYVTYTNEKLVPQAQYTDDQLTGYRIPEFDIEITVEKANPYKKMEHNEFILQLYNLGVFNPQNADQSLALINHLDFDGKDKIIETVERNKTLTDLLLQYQKIALSLALKVDPAMAQQLADTIVSADNSIAASAGGSIDLSAISGKEHPFGQAARSQARNSTQVS